MLRTVLRNIKLERLDLYHKSFLKHIRAEPYKNTWRIPVADAWHGDFKRLMEQRYHDVEVEISTADKPRAHLVNSVLVKHKTNY